jgi:hypothetical protein
VLRALDEGLLRVGVLPRRVLEDEVVPDDDNADLGSAGSRGQGGQNDGKVGS